MPIKKKPIKKESESPKPIQQKKIAYYKLIELVKLKMELELDLSQRQFVLESVTAEIKKRIERFKISQQKTINNEQAKEPRH